MSTLNDEFPRWFCGDEGACEFAATIWSVTQEWDDLIDEGTTPNVNALLSWLAFGKEYTPYFAAHAHILRPALLQLYLSWRAANVLERGSSLDREKAFMLRAGFYNVLHVMAWLAGGDDHAAAVGPEIYRAYGETLADLEKEFG